ncbi:MAG: hypothetical protein ACTSYE_10635 [Alphaproteobacteria bacterium]
MIFPALAAAMLLAACQSSSIVSGKSSVRNGLATADLAASVGYFNRSRALRAEYQALQFGATGAPIGWRGWSGRRGSVIPGPNYRINSFDCPDYSHAVVVGATTVVARGTACRQRDGSWRLNV